jgi:Trypsin-like peptidase domain
VVSFPNDPPGVYPVNNMAHYNGVFLSVHFVTDEWSTVEGSAVMVAPGVAFAAAHVVEPHMPLVMASKLRIQCVGYTPSGPRFWRVGQVRKVDRTDLVILSLKYASALPADGRFGQAAVSTRPPAIGEQVMVAGLQASDEHVPADESMSFTVKEGRIVYGANVRIGVGEVTQYFPNGRGAMPPGPAIEVACSTPGGLSGGPAFDRPGRFSSRVHGRG